MTARSAAPPPPTDRGLILLAVMLTAAIFVIGFKVPLVIGTAPLYVIVVLLGLRALLFCNALLAGRRSSRSRRIVKL